MQSVGQTIKNISQDIANVPVFIKKGLRAVAPLTADSIDATKEFLNLDISANPDYARILIDTIQQQPEKIKWGFLGGGKRSNATELLHKL